MPESELAGDGKRSDDADRKAAQDVGDEEHAPSLQPVGDRPAEEHERNLRHCEADADEGERGRCVRQLVDLPHDRDEVDPVAEQRDRHPGPEQTEFAHAERAEEASVSQRR